MPLLHVCPKPQGTPQPPQLFGSVSGSTHPLPQEMFGGKQVPLEQAELMQVSWGGQACRQPPQFAGSVAVSTQVVAQVLGSVQATRPPLQVLLVGHPHAPLLQVWVSRQVLLQKPQLWGSEEVVTQAPLHNAWPMGHEVTTQTPASQVWFAEQIRPHPPQLVLLVCSFTHVCPQSCSGGVQTMPVQVPPWQFDPVGHLLPQPPQLFGSLAVLVHVPPQTSSLTPHSHWP